MKKPYQIVQLLASPRLSGVSAVASVYLDCSVKNIYLRECNWSISRLFKLIFVLRKLKKENFIIHSHGLFADIINFISGRKNRFSTVHNFLYHDYKFLTNDFIAVLLEYLHVYILKKMTVVSCGESVKNYLLEKGIETEALYNGLSYNIQKKKWKIFNSKTYYFSGPFIKRKGIKELVDFFLSQKAEGNLYLYGQGKLKLQLELEYLNTLTNSNIYFKNYTDIDSAFNKFGFYISFSKNEGFPMSVIEACFMGLVPLLSNIGPHKEIIEMLNIGELPTFDTVEDAYLWSSKISDRELNNLSIEIESKSKNLFNRKFFSNRVKLYYDSKLCK